MFGTSKDNKGILVEAVDLNGPAAKAGVRAGDRLLCDEDRVLFPPAALLAAKENVVGRKQVTLHLNRDGQTLTLSVPTGSLKIDTRPDLPTKALASYESGKAALRAEDLDKAIHWRERPWRRTREAKRLRRRGY